MAVEAGQQAQDFDLQVNADTRVRLEDFRGEKNVLLVFHPYAFTGICEAESCDIQDNLERYREAETEVVFVSCDAWPARQAWKKESATTTRPPPTSGRTAQRRRPTASSTRPAGSRCAAPS